jgi:solute carrier family 8 (sodium/calcium exchanger)
MALGSSAPEILLSVIDTLNTLGEIPGELGVFSIVGSAAFNLLAISGICIISVDEPKKIYDLGVFGVTASFSLFAYIWMNMVLSDEIVEVWEAFLTFAFFFILVILAFAADRFKDRQMKNKIKDQNLSD